MNEGRTGTEPRVSAELLLYAVTRELPTSDANVNRHADLQALHRRVIEWMGEEDPGSVVTSECPTSDTRPPSNPVVEPSFHSPRQNEYQ